MPEEILTDNAKVFTGRIGPYPAEVLFDRICRENGIAHRLTAIRSPTTTGKIERFHWTLRREFLAGRTFESLEEAQKALDAWVVGYNNERPHQSIGMATPAERFAVRSGPEPDIPPPSPGPPSGQRITRRVSGNGFIWVQNQHVHVGRRLAYRRVTVHVDSHMLHVYVGKEHTKTVLRKFREEVRFARAHQT